MTRKCRPRSGLNNPGVLKNTMLDVASLHGLRLARAETRLGNKTANFYTPEHGTVAYWDLLKRYRAAGASETISQIINRYGGRQD